MKKALGLILTLLFLPLCIFAESSSLDAYIESVSGGVKGFGLGLFPLGTTFGFERYIDLVPGENKAEFQIELNFAFNNRTLSAGLAVLVGSNSIKYGPTLAATVISILPLLVLFLFGQRFFIEGTATSGSKE